MQTLSSVLLEIEKSNLTTADDGSLVVEASQTTLVICDKAV
jgi:hypothetical protein